MSVRQTSLHTLDVSRLSFRVLTSSWTMAIASSTLRLGRKGLNRLEPARRWALDPLPLRTWAKGPGDGPWSTWRFYFLRGWRIRRDACCRDVCAHCRVLGVPQGYYKGPRHANRGVVYSDDPRGRIHADNHHRHVCATRGDSLRLRPPRRSKPLFVPSKLGQ